MLRRSDHPGAPAYFFLHIPKTAGTSLVRILEPPFPPDRIARGRSEQDGLLDLPVAELGRWDLVWGHCTWAIVERFDPFPRILTMIREPVARSVSHIRHVRSAPQFWLHRYLPLAGMTIDEALLHPLVRHFLRDYQTRIIGWDFRFSEIPGPPILDVPLGAGREVLDSAIGRLERCAFVGISERFADSMELLERTLGWPMPAREPRENRFADKPDDHGDEPSPQTLAAIRALVPLDLELYEFARRRFERQLAETRAAVPRWRRLARRLVRRARSVVSAGEA